MLLRNLPLIALLAVLVHATLPKHANASFESGNSLLSQCLKGREDGADSTIPFGKCTGFIRAISDVLQSNQLYGLKVCIPDKSTAGQQTDVVVKWLEDHPGDRHFTASSLVVLAFSNAFPCRK